MKGLFLRLVAISLVVLVTHAQESDIDRDHVFVEVFSKDEDAEDAPFALMSENDDEAMSEYADEELQDETSSEEGSDESDEADVDEGRRLHDGLTKLAHIPIASKIHRKSPEEVKSVKPKRVKKNKSQKNFRGVPHNKTTPRKVHEAHEVSFVPLKKAPAIVLPVKKGTPHKNIRVFKDKKFKDFSHSHSDEN